MDLGRPQALPISVIARAVRPVFAGLQPEHLLQIVFTNLLAPHFFYQIANLIAIGVTSVLNFLLNDVWTFERARLMGASKK